MIDSLRALLARGEVELVLTGVAERRNVEFVLLDCDGNPLASLTCTGASVVCVTAHSAMYERADWCDRQNLPSAIGWLRESVPEGGGVLLLHLVNEAEEEALQWGLPKVGAHHSAYIVCRGISLALTRKDA